MYIVSETIQIMLHMGMCCNIALFCINEQYEVVRITKLLINAQLSVQVFQLKEIVVFLVRGFFLSLGCQPVTSN